jgi:hypothetical protein
MHGVESEMTGWMASFVQFAKCMNVPKKVHGRCQCMDSSWMYRQMFPRSFPVCGNVILSFTDDVHASLLGMPPSVLLL